MMQRAVMRVYSPSLACMALQQRCNSNVILEGLGMIYKTRQVIEQCSAVGGIAWQSQHCKLNSYHCRTNSITPASLYQVHNESQ